ncbi:MAG: hypothetical protein KF708_19845 [Pirellulales bacterium]|nr:hypothetical protein [Pirellulales bacterium]
MPLVSGLLDFGLSVVCVVLAIGSTRARNDFFFAGMLWIAAAALVGAFNLGGFTQVAPAHGWLSDVAGGPGMLSLAIGVLAALYGPWPWSRWGAVVLSVVGVAAIELLRDSPLLDTFTTLLGVSLLVALLLLAWYARRERQPRAMAAALVAVGLFLGVAFGLHLLPWSPDGALRRVDAVHVLLAASYLLVWSSTRRMSRT